MSTSKIDIDFLTRKLALHDLEINRLKERFHL